MEHLIEEWIRTLQSRDLMEKVIIGKRRHVTSFINHAGVSLPSGILPSHIDTFQRHITGRCYHSATVRRMLTDVRDFILYLRNRSLTLIDPAIYMQIPGQKRSLPRDILTESDISRILNLLHGIRRLRLRTMVELFYATGIRKQELINLNLYDLNIRERTLLVRQGKGKKDRLLPVTKSTITVVARYIKEIRSKKASNTTALIVRTDGTRITDGDIQSGLYGIRKRLKIKQRLTAHVLRHSIATHLVRRGVDIRYVQAFLGHADLTTTQIYTRVVKDDLRKEIDRCHPRNKMKG